MDRREFLKKTLDYGVAAGAAYLLGKTGGLFGDITKINAAYDLVAVKNGEPDVMLDAALKELGGMGQFVKKGQTVVVKPNAAFSLGPERGCNTNPLLITQIIRRCLDAGAKKVYVFDHTLDNPAFCYKNSGIEKAVKDAGGIMAPGNSEANYHTVSIPNGKVQKETQYHELVLESDVFINVPILKNHGGDGLTIAMKNLMGAIWDREVFHSTNLQQSIADLASCRKPDLNIVDAYYVLWANGPRGNSLKDVKKMKTLLVSKDIVAVDSAAAQVYGIKPSNLKFSVKHLKTAYDMGLGEMNLDKLNIRRISL